MKNLITFVIGLVFSVSFLYAGEPENFLATSGQHKYHCHNNQGLSLRLDMGLNNYLQDGQFPDAYDALYSVKPWGSWNVFLGIDKISKIVGPLYFNYGTGVSWYNFKFDNPSARLLKEDDGVTFYSVEDPAYRYTKSKLTAAYLDVFLVPTFYFGKDRYGNNEFFDFDKENGFRIGFGAYAGYKLDSYARYIYKEDGHERKDRKRSGYYLENFRYGARVQMGVNGLDIYANYDLNELFLVRKGPKLNAFSFGIIL